MHRFNRGGRTEPFCFSWPHENGGTQPPLSIPSRVEGMPLLSEVPWSGGLSCGAH